MRCATLLLFTMVLPALPACAAEPRTPPAVQTTAAQGRLSRTEFDALMHRLADAWNHNDARRAADCFTEDARYSAPPDPQVRRGREELYRRWGGERGRPKPMLMTWHHIVFDEAQQMGAGEYTFKYEMQTHGIVLVRIANGRIAQWREWEHESPESFESLTKDNAF